MGRERELADIIGATGINVPSADTFQVSGTARIANTYIDVPDGATGSRPGTPSVGMLYFNTTTDNLEQYTSGGWAPIEQAPTVMAISPTTSSVTGTSITLTGSGYKAGCTVHFVGTDSVAITAGSVSITNATTIVATTPALSVALEPYDVKVPSPGGLTGELTDGLYEEANKSYYISWNPDWSLKSNIAYILHQADSMATHIENDEWKHGVEASEKKHQEKYQNLLGNLKTDDSDIKEKPVKVKEDNLNKKSKDLFNELFGDV